MTVLVTATDIGNVIPQNKEITATEKLKFISDSMKSGDISMIQELIKAGADVNAVSNKGFRPLIAASMEGHVEIVRLLLNSGADVNAVSNNNVNALHVASVNGHIEIVRLLLDTNIDVNAAVKNNRTALVLAAQNGYTEIVRLLISAGSDVNIAYRTKDGYRCFFEIIDMKIWSDTAKATIKSLQVKRRREERIWGDSTALIFTSQKGYTEIVRLLLDAGALINTRGIYNTTALIGASEAGHFQTVRLLLDAGADVNAKEEDNATALMLAAQNGHTRIVRMLLNAEADANAKFKQYAYKALQISGYEIFLDSDNHFLTESNSINSPTSQTVPIILSKKVNSLTPLFLASQNGHSEIVKLLIDAGAKLDAKGIGDATALIMASINGYSEIVKLLIDAGAKTDVRMEIGGETYTVLDLAEKQGHSKIIMLLKKSFVKGDE